MDNYMNDTDLSADNKQPTKSIHSFEEAVALIGNGRFHFLLLIATGCSLLGVTIEGLNMAIVLPAAKCDIDISTTEQGLINAVSLIGVVLTSRFWGFMSDTWGRLKVLRFALLYQPLMVWLIMTMDWKYNVLGFVYSPWRLYMVLSSLINAFAYCIFLLLPESPKFMLAMGKPKEALDILIIGYKANGGKETFPVTQISLESIGSNVAETRRLGATVIMIWNQTWPLFKPPYVSNILFLCFVTFVCFFVGHGVYMWYPQILALSYPNMHLPLTICEAVELTWSKQEYEIIDTVTTEVIEFSCQLDNDSTTYQIILVMGMIFCCIYGFVALNVNRFGKSLLFPLWLFISATATLCVIWADEFYFNIVLAILMISCGYCGTIITAVAADLFPTHYKGMALCLVMMFGRIGAVLGSSFVGALLDVKCDAIFLTNSSLLLVATCLCFVVLRKTDLIMRNVS